MRDNQGTRTHIFLVFAMAPAIAIAPGLSLLVIRHQLTNQVTDNLSQDLVHIQSLHSKTAGGKAAGGSGT